MKEVIWPRLQEIKCIVFDFDGVFTDNKVYVDQNGVESVRCDRGDGLGIDFLRNKIAGTALSEAVFILSKEKNPVVLARAKKLKIKCIHDVNDKLSYLRAFAIEGSNGNSLKDVVYLGNDLNDLPVILRAGFSVVPEDAHDKVKAVASVVLPHKGGQGFVRAFVEKILGISELTPEKIDEFIYHS